jgi:hypothetical protein
MAEVSTVITLGGAAALAPSPAVAAVVEASAILLFDSSPATASLQPGGVVPLGLLHFSIVIKDFSYPIPICK